MNFKHPAALFMFCLVAGAIMARLVPLPLPIGFSAQIAAGAVVLVIAVAIWLLGARQMQKARTPIEPGTRPVTLVTTGPFRFSRNPLYVALVATQAAIGVLVSSWWIEAAAAVLMLLLDRMIIPGEESALAGLFPADFAAYRRRVRRWL